MDYETVVAAFRPIAEKYKVNEHALEEMSALAAEMADKYAEERVLSAIEEAAEY